MIRIRYWNTRKRENMFTIIELKFIGCFIINKKTVNVYKIVFNFISSTIQLTFADMYLMYINYCVELITDKF